MDLQKEELTEGSSVPSDQSNVPMTEEEKQKLIARAKESGKEGKRNSLLFSGMGILGLAFYYIWRLVFSEIISIWFIRLDILSIAVIAVGIVFYIALIFLTKNEIKRVNNGERITIK